MNALLKCVGLSKFFGGVTALDTVDFELEAGEVHALAGENGAGKSTLMHLLAGVHQPDLGSIELDCGQREGPRPVRIQDECHAQLLGIAIVYQERSLFPLLSVAENLFANHPPVNALGLIDRRRLYHAARDLLMQVELDLDPRLPLERLSPAQQQMIEIAKALSLESKILILDEPTAALTVPETETLFRIIRQLKQRGVGIIYISHRLQEIFEISDRVSVLKNGVMRGAWPVVDVNADFLVSRMVGREQLDVPHRSSKSATAPKLVVRNLSDAKLRDISFEAFAGEILGLAGLAGAGRTETALAIFGCRPLHTGEVFVDGQCLDLQSPREPMAAGIGYVPEDRKELGLFLNMTVADNIAAASLSRPRLAESVRLYMERLRIVASGPSAFAATLSGGNQQKVLLARWLLRDPGVLIVDEPTRGVDVAAKAEIHRILRELADRGAAVIVISSELPEILAVSDRILILREGRVAGLLPRAEASEEAILRKAATYAESRP